MTGRALAGLRNPTARMDGRCFCPDQKRLVMACGGRNVINLAGYRAKRGADGPWACVFSVIWPRTSLFFKRHRLGVRAKPVKSKQVF